MSVPLSAGLTAIGFFVTPTSRSKALLEREGCLVAIVERWNPFAKVRQDLFGIIDLLAVNSGTTIAVQTTSLSNVATRRTKMQSSEALPRLIAAGWCVELHGWSKVKNRWFVKRETAFL